LNQHPGCGQAPASKPYCCSPYPSLQMRQAGWAVTFHFLQLQGCSRALYPFQGLRAANPRSEASKASTCSSAMQTTRQEEQEEREHGRSGSLSKHTKQAQVRISYTISQRKSIRYRIIGISYAICHTISHAISHLNRYRMRYRMRYRIF